MSNTVFPTFTGLKWGVVKVPMHKTGIKETPSGREFRTRYMTYPRYLYKLSYEVLRETVGFTELQQLIGLFNTHGGSFESFLFPDPDDNAVTAQVVGTGTGSATQFQLVRTLGGFVEPVYAVNGSPSIYLDAVLQSSGYTISSSGLITFTSAPGNGVVVTWTGSYYWRVRFVQDRTEFVQFLKQLWEARSVELITTKP
jgi:uncharacterized protein (TIGR02217 family)